MGLSWAFIVAIVLLVALVILQKKTVFGKYLVAAGGNRTAAELSGINVVKVVWGGIHSARRGFRAGGRRTGELSAHWRALYRRWRRNGSDYRVPPWRNGVLRRRRLGGEIVCRRADYRLPDLRTKIRYSGILAASCKRRGAGIRGGAESSAVQGTHRFIRNGNRTLRWVDWPRKSFCCVNSAKRRLRNV